jgi:hypothetical protein
VHTGFWYGDLRDEDHLKDQGLNGGIILKRKFKKWDGEAWNRWRPLEDTVMNFLISQNV